MNKVDILFVNNNKKGFFYASPVIVLFFDNGYVGKTHLEDDDDVSLIEYFMLDVMEDLISSSVIKCKNNTVKIFKTLIIDNIINGLKSLPKINILWDHTK